MNRDDIAYAAGLFDAEGCITIEKSKDKSMIAPCYSLRSSLTSSNQPVIKGLKANFGGYILKDERTKITSFQWKAKANIAANFLQNTLPHLRIKKPQAKLGLQFQKEIKKNVGYNRVTPESLRFRERIKNQISALNQGHSQKEFRSINECKTSYVAGLLDGDGSIFIRKQYQNYYLQINISSTNRAIIHWLKNNFGGCIFVNKGQEHFLFNLDIKGNLTENILQQILPYLRIKKPQAKLALQFREEKKRNRYRRLTPKNRRRYEQFKRRIQILNPRGRN